jgi:hypothetical protein
VEAEQIRGRPAERLRLLAQAGEEVPTVLDDGLPAVDRDEVWAAGFESRESATKAM